MKHCGRAFLIVLLWAAIPAATFADELDDAVLACLTTPDPDFVAAFQAWREKRKPDWFCPTADPEASPATFLLSDYCGGLSSFRVVLPDFMRQPERFERKAALFAERGTLVRPDEVKVLEFDPETLTGFADVVTDYGFSARFLFRLGRENGAPVLRELAIPDRDSDDWEQAFYLKSTPDHLLKQLSFVPAPGRPALDLKLFGGLFCTFTISGSIEVTDPATGEVLQSGSLGRDMYMSRYWGRWEHEPELLDVSFDGVPELLIHSGCGVQNHVYWIFFWNPELRNFVCDEIFSYYLAGAFEFDAARRSITCGWHLSASEFPRTTFLVRDGKLCDAEGRPLPGRAPEQP